MTKLRKMDARGTRASQLLPSYRTHLYRRHPSGSLRISTVLPTNSARRKFGSTNFISLTGNCTPGASGLQTAALRFFYRKVLRRPLFGDDAPLPKVVRRQPPTVLSRDEVARLIDAAPNLRHKTILMTLYSTGIRCSELCHLRPEDIDKERMVIRIRQGKGGKDRDVPLCGETARATTDPLSCRETTQRLAISESANAASRPADYAEGRLARLSAKPAGAPASPRASTRIRCATALPPTCSTMAPNCRSFRPCSATPIRATP